MLSPIIVLAEDGAGKILKMSTTMDGTLDQGSLVRLINVKLLGMRARLAKVEKLRLTPLGFNSAGN